MGRGHHPMGGEWGGLSEVVGAPWILMGLRISSRSMTLHS